MILIEPLETTIPCESDNTITDTHFPATELHMAKNKKPKKAYRPRHTPALPPLFRFDRDTEIKLQLIPHQLLEGFRNGTAVEEDWHSLAARLNLGTTLAFDEFDGQEIKDAMNAAMDALKSVWDRYKRTGGKLGTTGEEWQALSLGLNLTDDMQKNCTRLELTRAMGKVFRAAAVPRMPPRL